MGIDPHDGCNWEIYPTFCTLNTCCLDQWAAFNYLPNFGGNVFFAAFFGVAIIPNIYLGVRYKTWGYMAGMVIGCLLEVLGYAAKLMLRNNPWSTTGFLL